MFKYVPSPWWREGLETSASFRSRRSHHLPANYILVIEQKASILQWYLSKFIFLLFKLLSFVSHSSIADESKDHSDDWDDCECKPVGSSQIVLIVVVFLRYITMPFCKAISHIAFIGSRLKRTLIGTRKLARLTKREGIKRFLHYSVG